MRARDLVLEITNEHRRAFGKPDFFLHEDLSQQAQLCASYVLSQLKQGRECAEWVHEHPPSGNAENVACIRASNWQDAVDRAIWALMNSPSHAVNILNGYTHMGAEIAYDSETGLVVVVQRFTWT